MEFMAVTMAGARLIETAEDIVSLVHLASIAIGMGTGVTIAYSTLRRIDLPITSEICNSIRSAQDIILFSLIVALASGVLLAGVQSNFALAQIDPEVWGKLIIVNSLVLTAFAAKRIVTPVIEQSIGQSFLEIDLNDKLGIAICVGLSTAGWCSALLLCGVDAADAAPGWLVLGSVLLIHVISVMLALRNAFSVHGRVRGAVDLVEQRRTDMRIY